MISKPVKVFTVSAGLGAFIVTKQWGKKTKYYNLPIAFINYCRKAQFLN